MNSFLRVLFFIVLLAFAVVVWFAIGLTGLFFAFTKYPFIYYVTPFIGLVSVVCIIKYAMYILLKSNPATYIETKFDKLEALLGKKKI